MKNKTLINNALLLLSMIVAGCVVSSCEAPADTSSPSEWAVETVQVPLCFSFSDESSGVPRAGEPEPGNPSRGTRAGEPEPGNPSRFDLKSSGAAFEVKPTPDVLTRASAQPDALYNLEVRQYDGASGSYLNGKSLGTVAIGSKITVPLTPSDNCQLVIVARGDGNTVPELGTRSLSDVQTNITANSTVMNTLTDMNKMPYVLHLKHVKVVDAGNGNGTIRSTTDGTDDVRLLLKRLAARVTLHWSLNDEMKVAGYELKEVKLCQVPSTYYLLPPCEETEWGTTYPSTVSEFVDVYRLTGAELTTVNSSKTVWIPANVRGVSSASSAPIHRTKENAPVAASYAELVVDNSAKKERLYYRAYLGSQNPTDFNLCENTDYSWTVTISSANYTTDPRIQLLDQTPVQSENLVSTANCLMLQPGGNLCFNPYRHTSGTNGWNDQLVSTPSGGPAAKTAIGSVKVLWQSKDTGTSGDLVLGYVIDDSHHENLVNITDAGDINRARVHVKAPVTEGGNAVIAAYAADGVTILWSWHVWVTDYVPARISNYDDYRAAQQRTKNGTVHKYRSALWQKGNLYANMVIMDREIGARTGGFPGITIGDNYTLKDAVNTQGLLYQWGRKDPFFGSADGSTNEINVIFDGYGIAKSVTNLARNSAILVNNTYLQYTVEHPLTFLYYWSNPGNSDWWDVTNGNEMTEAGGAYRWNAGGAAAPGKKTIYDPCPDGWKVPMRGSALAVNRSYFTGSIFDGFQDVTGGTPTYNERGDVSLNSSSSYFTYSIYNFQGRFYWKNEYDASKGGLWESKANPKGGKLFFLEDGLTLEEKQKWTIHNTFWFPVAAERHPAYSGRLMNPSIGHNWTADGDVCGSLFCIKPMIMQLGYYGRTYGWSVRCIQE